MSAATNPFRLGLKAWRAREGLVDFDAFMDFLASVDGQCPALCTEGCETDPDGGCPHGCPAVLIAAGVI